MPVAAAHLAVEDGQYWITDGDPDAEFVLPRPGGSSGLVGVAGNLAIVITGTQFGNISVTVQAGDADPGLDTGPWDEVAEVSVTCGQGSQGLGITSAGQGPQKLQGLTPLGSGSYRVRVHARGRDIGAEKDVVTGTPAEQHLIQVWPAPSTGETVHKTTDEQGKAFRDVDETRPDPRLPHGRYIMLHVNQPVASTDRAEIELQRIDVRKGGCELTFKIIVDVSGLPPRKEKRARRAVDGYEGATLPENSDPGWLRIEPRYSDGQIVEFSDDTGSLSRIGPAVTPCSSSNYPDGDNQVAEEGFWLWPLPPAEPFTLTLEWPAVGIPPSSVTIDGAAIAEAARGLPDE